MVLKFNFDNALKNDSTPLVVLFRTSSILLNTFVIPFVALSNIPELFTTSVIDVKNFPTFDDTVNNISPKPTRTPLTGVRVLSNATTIFLPKSITENTPLNVFLILAAGLIIHFDFFL